MSRFTFLLLFFCYTYANAQKIGDFVSVTPLTHRSDTLILPETHTFQYLIKTGDTLMDGSTVGGTLDFTGFVQTKGLTEGWLSVSSETQKAQIAMLYIKLHEEDHRWEVTQSANVDFYSPKTSAAIGRVAYFCSGGITPWNTVIVGEETDKPGDVNADGYEDAGWLVEVKPETKAIAHTDSKGKPQKLWKLGRMKHENVCIDKDQKTCYYGADSERHGYVYKFIADKAGDLTKGKLFVLMMETDKNSSKGTWVRIANNTQQECNNTNTLATQVHATNFSGVEDVEIGPDGKIYFTAKYSGRLYRFKDGGDKITESEVYVENNDYPIKTSDGKKVMLDWHSGLTGNDNLAFDGEGNLWVMNDGGNNGIWVVRPGHSKENPQIELFAETPKGCEPSGITFSKDYKYLFLSLQNPASGGQQKDKTGKTLLYNTSHTIVISRK